MATDPVTNPGMWNAVKAVASNAYQAIPSTTTVSKYATDLATMVADLAMKVFEIARPVIQQCVGFVETHQTEVLTTVAVVVLTTLAYKAVNAVYQRCCGN